jgi:hypothetical protein
MNIAAPATRQLLGKMKIQQPPDVARFQKPKAPPAFGSLLRRQLFVQPNLDQRLASNPAQGGFLIEFG